ncbi:MULTISPECIES: 2-amino-4-oxopentanoate thiolase subunit OrtA [Clostridium]|jgi:hypothetical protein|uniref:2-amino-4-oxopentanoate thiolase subunit OrtA n=1 Tax=Clostridium lapidicellarium TaxID=3240931 RepID=A0ABV4DWY1_9CLOT|nr:2-amino-4-oxopentanoate thiolase subunit OrtA [uncultured Clostridium sp.]NLU07780.1 2-amino-4-ketopentanoate thiolase [Clostridiales bacterium]
MIEKGTWVEIEKIVLLPKDRAKNIPKETKKTALKCWIKGNCLTDCELDDDVKVVTKTGRIVDGRVVDVEPGYYHSFGKYIREIGDIGKQAKKIIG